MPDKRIPDPGFAGDEGAADPALTAALEAHARDEGRLPDVLSALHRARVLAPVVALLGEADVTPEGLRRDKSADIAVPLLTGEDGRTALPVFTSLRTLGRWDPAARPVPVEGPRAAHVALGERAEVLVLDVAGPLPCVLEGPEVRALAEGRGQVPAYDDAALSSSTTDVLRSESWVVAAWLLPQRGVDARLTVQPDPAVPDGDLPGLLGGLAQRLGGLDSWRRSAVRGVDLAVSADASVPPGGPPLFTRASPE